MQFFPCGVKTTLCHILYISVYFLCYWHPELQLSLSPSYSYFFISFLLITLKLAHTYTYVQCSPTGSIKLAQRDGNATSSSSPSQFRAECRTWRCRLHSHFSLIRPKTLKAFLLCDAAAWSQHYTKGHQGFQRVFVAFCCIFVLYSVSLLLLFPFSSFLFSAGILHLSLFDLYNSFHFSIPHQDPHSGMLYKLTTSTLFTEV